MLFNRAYLIVNVLQLLHFFFCYGIVLIEYTSTISSSVLLERCHNESGRDATWTFEEVVIFINKYDLNKEWADGIQILSNGSLFIESVSLSNEGIYKYISGSTTRFDYYVIIKVPPNLFLSFDGKTLANKTYVGDHNYNESKREEQYVEEGKEINVTCLAEGAKPQANLTWTINGEGHDGVDLQNTTNREESRTFDSRSTLRFIPTGPNITITCNSSLQGTDIENLISATLLTYVKPKMALTINGVEISPVMSTKTYVEKNEEVNITCHAFGARPAPQLIWVEKFSYSEPQQNETRNNTFDITSTLAFNSSQDEDVVTCMGRIDEVNITVGINLTLVIYVLPEPSLTVDGDSSDLIFMDQEEEVTVICDASETRPEPNLTWTINGYPVDETKVKIKTLSPVLSTLSFHPQHNDTVTCIIFLGGPKKTRSDSVKFNITEKIEDPKDGHEDIDGRENTMWIVLGAIATFVVVLVYCVCNATRKVKASKSSNLSAIQLANTFNDRPVNGVSMSSRELPAIRQSMLISPEVDNEDIYWDVEDKAQEVANVEMVVQLPGEGMFQYWTANAAFNNDASTKIIAKCVSDSVQMKDHMKFKTLAESLATLKKHRNIIDILGVSTANVPYYIYTEYLEYGTLRDFLMRNYQQSRDSQCNISEALDERAILLTGFALDVVDGLMYLTDRDYRHPALCTRKVLLNKTCTCKLYDFWPKSLSTERMHQILQKPFPPVAWLPPETIFLRHYSDKSDVWTFGIVAWEIYSLGEIPYGGLTCEEIEQEIRKMGNLDQPLTCPGGIYSMMLASWDTSVDERPDLSEWKQKLVCLLQSAKQDSDDTGDRSYFTLEDNSGDYEDDYIEK